jgi:DNA polymerase-3 subunit epsilon
MDFVAFDFETANSRADSACQLAAVRIRNGQIVAERSWLIRPPRLYFSPRNIAIHGIRPEQVADAATMEQVWPEFLELADGEVLVAHNARFDIGVLVASLAAYDVACPHLEFSCTRAIARRAWPGRSGYGLKPLGSWLGVDFRHHDALEDSRCCAQIALAAARVSEAQDFPDLERRLRLTRGRTSLGQISGPRIIGGNRAPARSRYLSSDPPGWMAGQAAAGPLVEAAQAAVQQAPPSVFEHRRSPSRGQLDPHAVLTAAAGSQPLAGKRIVCLGSLRGLSAIETGQLLEALGATWQQQISADTDYVVACSGMLIEEANRIIASETESCAPPSSLPAQPTIRLLSERQFLALLPGGKAAVRW